MEYTLLICFNESMDKVVLMLKNRPLWQMGRYNFPGGKIDYNETLTECAVREFEEECGLVTDEFQWLYIGKMYNAGDSPYDVHILTTILNNDNIKTMEDQEVSWFNIDNLPKNKLSNIGWLTYFALNYHKQGNCDKLVFGTFKYE